MGETYSENNVAVGGIFYSLSTDDTNGEADGVVGKTFSNDNEDSYGVYSSGDFAASGDKNAIVYTDSQGPTKMYSLESTEVWFEDIGEAFLVDGYAYVELDPLFLETVVIDEHNPIQVFLTPYGDLGSNSIYVDRSSTAFEIIETNEGHESITVGYLVLAKRKYYEEKRMRATKAPIDQFMRPDLSLSEIDQLT